MNYPEAEQGPNFSQIEREIIRRWADDRTFKASVDRRLSKIDGQSNEFVFYDGPPFANGLPHYGHLATGFVKDVIPRYRGMCRDGLGGIATVCLQNSRLSGNSDFMDAMQSSITASLDLTQNAGNRC